MLDILYSIGIHTLTWMPTSSLSQAGESSFGNIGGPLLSVILLIFDGGCVNVHVLCDNRTPTLDSRYLYLPIVYVISATNPIGFWCLVERNRGVENNSIPEWPPKRRIMIRVGRYILCCGEHTLFKSVIVCSMHIHGNGRQW